MKQDNSNTRTDSAGTQGDPKDVRTYGQDSPPLSSDCRGIGRDGFRYSCRSSQLPMLVEALQKKLIRLHAERKIQNEENSR
jgi:hypothetical protein